MSTRRHVLAILAAGAPALAAFGSAAGCAPASDPAAPWRHPGVGERDPRRYALAHAILAPNPHNRQPWLVQLPGEDRIVLSVDPARTLPNTDPFDRQITLGCGAFLELLDLSARASGHRAEITLWPQGEPAPRLDKRPFADVRLTPDPMRAKDGLFDAITARRTNRRQFETRPVAPDDLRAIADAAAAPGLSFGWAEGGARRDALRALAWAASDREAHTPHAHLESVNLMRIGAAEIAAHRDGLTLEGPAIEAAHWAGLVTRTTLADPNNPLTKQGLEAFRPLALQAPAFLWLISEGDTRAAQIAAGRAYARLNLAANARGLSMHPWSQSLQEYPEMADLYARMTSIIVPKDGQRVQMLVRVGYGPATPPAPRRDLADHILA